MKHILAATVCAATLATGAHATTANIDFVTLVADIGEQGIEGQTFTFDGLDVTITSTSDAYLDGVSRGFPAGLGVCSSGLDGDNECNDPGDDNINGSEVVTLMFGSTVTAFSDFMFRGAAHEDITGSSDIIGRHAVLFDNGSSGFINFPFASVGDNFNDAIARRPNDAVVGISFAAAQLPYYLSGFTATYTPAPVPLPASVLLLGGALAGVGALKRRRKA